MLCRECATTSIIIRDTGQSLQRVPRISLPPLSRPPPLQQQSSSPLQDNRRTGSPHRRRGGLRPQLAGQQAAMRQNLNSLHPTSTDVQSNRTRTTRTSRARDTTQVRSAGRVQVDPVRMDSSESMTRWFPPRSHLLGVQREGGVIGLQSRPALSQIGIDALNTIVNHRATDEESDEAT
jgi:hypothetical protein